MVSCVSRTSSLIYLRSKSNLHPSGGQYRFIGVSPLLKYLIFGMGVSADLPYLCPYK